MRFEIVNTNIDAFHHVQKVGLEDEGFSRMIEHSGCVFKFLEVFQPSSNLVGQVQQVIL